jgi:hypothetical protein
MTPYGVRSSSSPWRPCFLIAPCCSVFAVYVSLELVLHPDTDQQRRKCDRPLHRRDARLVVCVRRRNERIPDSASHNRPVGRAAGTITSEGDGAVLLLRRMCSEKYVNLVRRPFGSRLSQSPLSHAGQIRNSSTGVIDRRNAGRAAVPSTAIQAHGICSSGHCLGQNILESHADRRLQRRVVAMIAGCGGGRNHAYIKFPVRAQRAGQYWRADRCRGFAVWQ